MRRVRGPITKLLRWYWVVTLFIGEIYLYYWHISSCKWPSKANDGVEPVHVAIVADPQIVDHYSYGQTGLLLRTVEFFTDIYMRKSYIFLQAIRRPDIVIFLGDLMDGGREWDDDVWLDEYARYKSIFANRSPRSMRVYDMAGNHDYGIGNTVVGHALDRFHEYIGPTNQVIEVADHQIVLLDTLTLEHDSASVNYSSRQLVERLANDTSSTLTPRILFSHVPLWRPDGTYCGPRRQSRDKFLLNRRGYQFRDQLFENTTKWLLESIRPAAVFSGDDHDTCTVEHPLPPSALSTGEAKPAEVATEYTIGAFGWASGVPIASYGLMTLYPQDYFNEDAPSFHVENCYLPYQLGIYKFYIASLVASLALVAVACYAETRNRRFDKRPSQPSSPSLSPMLLPQPAGILGSLNYQRMGSPASHGAFALFLLTVKDIAVFAVPAYIVYILYFYVA
ncbi:Metallo-dependent phosphatase [Martensiomyces pterosporus]|nr:Metallo-dependent phosphatase [Martensiomyces pterosporus]